MQDPQSLHKYLYVHGDPVQGVDPTGYLLAGVSVGGLIRASIIGAGLGGIGGFVVRYADVRLGGGSHDDAVAHGANLAIYGALFGAISGPMWLLALKGYGIIQAFAIAGATMEVSATAGFGAAAVGESIKNENYAQAGFRAAVAAFLVRAGARGLGGVRPRMRPIGDFSNLQGAKINDILDAIPPDARVRNWRPGQYVQDGVEFIFKKDGQTWKVRIHSPDSNPAIPPGNNAAQGWVVRVQRGTNYMDHNGTFHQPNQVQTDPVIGNNTHIPIETPTVSGRVIGQQVPGG
jgi:hypothetical protein